MTGEMDMENAIDSFVESLKMEQKNGKLMEDNSKNQHLEAKDDQLAGLDKIAKIIKRSIELICLGEEVRVNTDARENIISVHGRDLGIAIGKDGKNMVALEYIANLIRKRKNLLNKRVTLDIKDYRKKKLDKIKKVAEKMAKRAIKEGRKIALRPMCAYERKIIHNLLSKFKDVTTRSRYEEPNRRIIIYPENQAK
jgi:spoIIIJ-associated protein